MSPRRHSHRKSRLQSDVAASEGARPSGIGGNNTSVPASTWQSAGIRNWQLGSVILLSLLFFLLYVMTTSRSVPTGDSGELIAAAWNLGVAHQPGYPTFTMLSHVAGFLPFGTPAFRLNLLSALLDALALGILGFGALRLLQAGSSAFRNNAGWLIPVTGAVAGVGLLAVSTVFWRYSTVAEVFALNNFLAALTLVMMLEWVRQPNKRRFLWLSGLFAGLAMTNQLTIVLLAPALFTMLVGGMLRWRKEARKIIHD